MSNSLSYSSRKTQPQINLYISLCPWVFQPHLFTLNPWRFGVTSGRPWRFLLGRIANYVHATPNLQMAYIGKRLSTGEFYWGKRMPSMATFSSLMKLFWPYYSQPSRWSTRMPSSGYTWTSKRPWSGFFESEMMNQGYQLVKCYGAPFFDSHLIGPTGFIAWWCLGDKVS